jgi:hypothetical protein
LFVVQLPGRVPSVAGSGVKNALAYSQVRAVPLGPKAESGHKSRWVVHRCPKCFLRVQTKETNKSMHRCPKDRMAWVLFQREPLTAKEFAAAKRRVRG